MKNLNKFSSYTLYITCLLGAVWLGSYITRLFVTYRLFQEKDFVLKDYVTPQNLDGILSTLLPAFWITLASYLVFFIFFILFLVTAKLSLKNNGWLFIITVIIFLTFPFEAYLMSIDYKVVGLLTSDAFNSAEVLNFIIERFKVFSSFPVIEIFCYFAVIYLIIFQPLTKKIITEKY